MFRGAIEALGRYARWALPIGVLLGIAWPSLASAMHPLLTASVIGTLTIVLIRLDWAAMLKQARQPQKTLLITVFLLLLSPLIAWWLTSQFGLAPAISIALILQCAAPPVASAAAFALMTGIDGERVLVLIVITTLLLPLTLTPLVGVLLSQSGINIDMASFFVRVCLMVGAPFLIAIFLRRLIGVARLDRNDSLLSGINVVALVIFAIAIMDGVAAFLIADPAAALQMLLLAFAMALLLHLGGYLAFRWQGHEGGLVAALGSGNRNMGLMLAVTAGSAGPAAALYFGIAQIPMYCVPLLLAPLVGGNRARR